MVDERGLRRALKLEGEIPEAPVTSPPQPAPEPTQVVPPPYPAYSYTVNYQERDDEGQEWTMVFVQGGNGTGPAIRENVNAARDWVRGRSEGPARRLSQLLLTVIRNGTPVGSDPQASSTIRCWQWENWTATYRFLGMD